jgi:thiol:disulfide interchange protein
MSLRAFHLLFISLSVLLAAFFAAWSLGQYRAEERLVYVMAAMGSFACAGGLVWYGMSFQRKTRHL